MNKICDHPRMNRGPSGVHIFDTACPDCGSRFIIKKYAHNDPYLPEPLPTFETSTFTINKDDPKFREIAKELGYDELLYGDGPGDYKE